MATMSPELQALVDLAAGDEFLGPLIYSKALENIFPLHYGQKVVGFCIPQRSPDGRWRTGPIFVHPDYRGKGIAQIFIRVFFSDRPGRAWIDQANRASIATFSKAGFVRSGRKHERPGEIQYEYLKG